MSTINSSQAVFTDLFPMPLIHDHDHWTCGIASSKPNIILTTKPVMPLRNNSWFHAPGLLHMSDIPPLGRQIQPHKRVLPEEGCSLLSESSLSIRDAACTLPRYNLPQMVGRIAPQLKWQASVCEPSIDVSHEKPPTGNVWDMLVGLLGAEQGTERISTSYLDGKHYFSKADVSITSLHAGHNQEKLTVNSYKPAISTTNVGCQNSVKVLCGDVQVTEKQSSMKMNNINQVSYRYQFPTSSEYCQYEPLREEKVEKAPLCGSEYLLKSPLAAPNEKVNASRRSETMSNRNNETRLKKACDLLPVRIHGKDQLSAASMHVTKVMPQKSNNRKSTTFKSRRKGLVLPKQRKKLRKTKLYGKESLKAKDPLPLLKPEAGEEMTKQKPICLSVHPGFGHIAENEQCIQDPVMKLSRIVDNASLSKITSITMQCFDKKKELFMWTDTMMKFLNPLSKYERLHSVQMNNPTDESGSSNTVVLKFDMQPRLSLESELGHDNDVRRSVLGYMGSFHQNPHVTELFMSAQVPILQNPLSKSSSKMSQITNLWDIRNMKKSPFLQVSFAGLVPHDELLASQEGQNVHSPAQVCLQGTGGDLYQFAATMEETFPPEQQLKLLLHAGHCQLPECPVASCMETKKLLKHCSCCREESLCPVTHCSVSRTLLKHWRFCKVFHCPLCASVRHRDNVKFSIMGTRRETSYSTNSNKIKIYATSLMSNTSRNMANTTVTATTTNRGAGITTRICSTSTCSKDQMGASTSPRTMIIPPKPFLFGDKITTSKFNQCSLQESKRCFAPNVCGRSNLSQAEWNSPLGGNDLGEDLRQISWTMSLERDNQQLSANESESRNFEEGPKLAAGFTVSAQHLQQRLDCLLHGVTCEKSDQETSRECARKHCNIMKNSMIHMSSCNEFTSCSNVICLLFNPLLLHWKSCCGTCSVCGPINVKYNKKKLLKKISPEVVVNETKQEKFVFQGNGEIDGGRQRISRAAPYYLRKYMMEDQSSVPAEGNGYTPQLVTVKKVEGIAVPSAGNTWDQLPGIDSVLPRLLGKSLRPDSVNNAGSIRSHECNSSCPSYLESNSDPNKDCIQDLVNAINLYNYQVQE